MQIRSLEHHSFSSNSWKFPSHSTVPAVCFTNYVRVCSTTIPTSTVSCLHQVLVINAFIPEQPSSSAIRPRRILASIGRSDIESQKSVAYTLWMMQPVTFSKQLYFTQLDLLTFEMLSTTHSLLEKTWKNTSARPLAPTMSAAVWNTSCSTPGQRHFRKISIGTKILLNTPMHNGCSNATPVCSAWNYAFVN